MKRLNVGIDCHKLEDQTGAQRAGIGTHIYKLLEVIYNMSLKHIERKESAFLLPHKGGGFLPHAL